MSQAETQRAARPWSEQTYAELFELVLRAGALAADQPPPNDWLIKLRATAAQEQDLARELLPLFQSDSDWSGGVSRLPAWLIKNLGHPSNEPGELGNERPAADCHGQLLALCHLVLRLQTLEMRFVGELERQKLEAIYHFAYGLSHELNNPLANIATRAGLLASEEAQPRRQSMLETIVASAMRGCEMLGDLMLVARPPKLKFESARIDHLLSQLIERACVWGKPLQVEVRGELLSQASLKIDAVALTEAVWAVVRNAIEAMPGGGQVAIRLWDAEDSHFRQVVRIEISDAGSGLSRQALAHCFDPYYSGREAGRGLGLGLSKAKKIVQLHGGELSLDNRPGGGCQATFVLPLSVQR